MSHLLVGDPQSFSYATLFSPAGLKGDLPGCLSQFLLAPFTEGNGLPPFVCQRCQAKAESMYSKLYTNSVNLMKTASESASYTYKEASVPKTPLV